MISKYNYHKTSYTHDIVNKIQHLIVKTFNAEFISTHTLEDLIRNPLKYFSPNQELMRIHFVYSGSQILGCCFVFQHITPGLYYNTVVNLPAYAVYTVAIDPAYQGQGYGSLLMRKIQTLYPILHLTVNLDNSRALKFYQKLGFQMYHMDGTFFYLKWVASL